MHSVDPTLLPLPIYPITSTSIGQFLLQASHSVHGFPVGVFLMIEYRAGSFITSDTGQAILQKARFFRKMKARGTAAA